MNDSIHIVELGSVLGWPKAILRLEGLGLLVISVYAYSLLKGPWGIFALCFLLPDLSFLGYLVRADVGAAAYNALHSTLLPIAVGLAAGPIAYPYLLIWLAHIGFDRALGYGLKYSTGFGDTHLGRLPVAGGRPNANASKNESR